MPEDCSPKYISAFAFATLSMFLNPSKWAGAHWVITATFGEDILLNHSISPNLFAPISTTA